MELEQRYIIVKIKDAKKYLTTTEREIHEVLLEKISTGRMVDGKEELNGLCIEKDWLEYEPTLKLLSDRGPVMNHNIGDSNYAQKRIQPWDIWEEYKLNPWDADIVKRVLRDKSSQSRREDYEKIKHICDKRIEQIDNKVEI